LLSLSFALAMSVKLGPCCPDADSAAYRAKSSVM
jgi:hypothetical protein